MRVTLVYPPDLEPPSMPSGALPLLNGCLRRAGHQTQVLDLNAEVFWVAMRDGHVDRYLAVLDELTAKLAGHGSRTLDQEGRLRFLRRAHVYPRARMLAAPAAARALQDPALFYDPVRLMEARRVVHAAMSFLNHFVPRLDPIATSFVESLFAHVADEAPTSERAAYRERILAKIRAFAPDVVAISCPFSHQLVTSLRFARVVRAELPEVAIVIGGTGFSDCADQLAVDPRFFDHVHYAIVGDGEDSLVALLRAIAGDGDLDQVAGLWWRCRDAVRSGPPPRAVDLDTIPGPDFTGLDLALYLTPEPVATYTSSRGCYYNKCTFCPEGMRSNFRMRSPELVFADLRRLCEEHGIRHVHVFDPLTPPRTLAHVAREVTRERLPLRWYAEVKFEPIYARESFVAQLALGGCRMLQFGLESGVQRVLDDMKKGNRLPEVAAILAMLDRHGIAAAATWFIGFPTEDRDDALETWRFIERQEMRLAFSLYVGTFTLGRDVAITHDPGAYGIDIVLDPHGPPRYVRRDGRDWDPRDLHHAYRARSDFLIGTDGPGLLYAANRPERLSEIRTRDSVGPVSWQEPELGARRLSVPSENGCVEVGPGAGDERVHHFFEAQNAQSFSGDALDALLFGAIAAGASSVANVLARLPGIDGQLAAERLARLIDRGLVRSVVTTAARGDAGLLQATTVSDAGSTRRPVASGSS
jgi:hypothetical protein